MKKTLSVILVAVMLLSTLVSLVVPAAAEEAGNWDVMLSATAEDSEDKSKNPPVPGYYYDETGFHTISPDYTNYNPKFSVVSKEMYNIKDFTMTIVVHDYCVSGDNWLSFTIWSDCNGFAQGDTSGKYGDGWTSLIRPGTDGNVNRFESWDQRKGGRSGKQVFSNIDGTQLAPIVFEPIVDADTGDFTVTFSIENGIVKVNGSVVGAGTDQVISDRFKEGLAYVGVTVHNTDPSGAYSPTITITDVNGSAPTGSDRREAEGKVREFGPMRDSDSVPANTPAIWFDGTLEGTNNKLPTGSNCEMTYADDNQGIKVTAGAKAFYMQFEVPDEITYNAADFRYITFIFKNFCTCNLMEGDSANESCTGSEMGSIWYCAGQVTSPRNDCAGPIPTYYHVTPMDEDGSYLYDDYYTVAVFEVVNDMWADRIHGIRLDIGEFNNFGVEGMNTFEIMGAGIFRTGADLCGFVSEFRDLGLDTEWLAMDYDTTCDHFDFDEDGFCDICEEAMPEDPVEPPVGGDVSTEEGSDEVTTEPTSGEVTTEEGEVSGSEEETTKKPAATTAAASSDEGEEETKKGCGSVVSMGAIAIVAIVGTGLVIKKKED